MRQIRNKIVKIKEAEGEIGVVVIEFQTLIQYLEKYRYSIPCSVPLFGSDIGHCRGHLGAWPCEHGSSVREITPIGEAVHGKRTVCILFHTGTEHTGLLASSAFKCSFLAETQATKQSALCWKLLLWW